MIEILKDVPDVPLGRIAGDSADGGDAVGLLQAV